MLTSMLDILRGSRFLRRTVRQCRSLASSHCYRPDAFMSLARVARLAGVPVYIDIGCHHGDTIRRFLDVGPASAVFGFDPCAANLAQARRLVGADPRVSLYELALSDEDGVAEFFTNANEQTSSLLPNDEGNFRSFPAETMKLQSSRVQTRRLDTWAAERCPDRVAIVKCDTQGAEARVIRGGIAFIRDQVAAFYGEVMLDRMYQGQSTFEEIRGLLEGECGMVLQDVYPCMHDSTGRAVQMDALWVKPNMLEPAARRRIG